MNCFLACETGCTSILFRGEDDLPPFLSSLVQAMQELHPKTNRNLDKPPEYWEEHQDNLCTTRPRGQQLLGSL
jgi:hypothetical protein